MKNNAAPQLIEGCPICSSSSRALLTSVKSVMKSSDAELSDATGFSAAQIEEHFAQHISPPDTGDERLDAAITDAGEVYLAALISNDLRSATQAISVRGKLLSDLARRRKETVKAQNMLGKAVPGDMRTFPPELASFVEAHFNAILNRVVEASA